MTLQNYNRLIQQIDISRVNHSLIAYYRELNRWFQLLLKELDRFESRYSATLTLATELQENLQQKKPSSPPPSADEILQKRISIQLERHLYSSMKLDCSLDQIRKDLLQFQGEVVAQQNSRQGARTLIDLHLLESEERPSFLLVTEHTYELLADSCNRVISFARKQEWIRYAFGCHNNLISIEPDQIPASEQNIRLMLLDQFLFQIIEGLLEDQLTHREITLLFSGDDHPIWDRYRQRLLERREQNPLKRKRSLLDIEGELFQLFHKEQNCPTLSTLLQRWAEQIIHEDLIDLQIYLLKDPNHFQSDMLHQVTRLKKFNLIPRERQKRYQSLLDRMIDESILLQE